MYKPAAGSGDVAREGRDGNDVVVVGGNGEDSSICSAEVRAVRQPSSRWVAHHESLSSSAALCAVSLELHEEDDGDDDWGDDSSGGK